MTDVAVTRMAAPALSLSENTTLEEWQELGLNLFKVARDLPWMVGDWLNFGERKYGDKYTQGLEAGMYDLITLRKCSWVCRNVPPERRRPSAVLSFKHHEVVTPLDAEQQEEMLRLAEEERLTVRELQYEVKRLRDPRLPPLERAVLAFDDWWPKYTVVPRGAIRDTCEGVARDAWRTARETMT